MYRYLLIDNDDTLMDFHLAEQHALGDTLRRHGIPDSEDILSQYHAINQALWKALERGETTQAKLKVERFRQLLAALGKDESRATELGEDFADALGNYNFLLPGAEEFLRREETLAPIIIRWPCIPRQTTSASLTRADWMWLYSDSARWTGTAM